MTHRFLSDEWIDAVLSLQEEYRDLVTPTEHSITMNQLIEDTPFGDEPVRMHLDSRSGLTRFGKGHLPEADVTITTDYETAMALFVEGDPQAAMQAFMSGRIAVEGDIAKMMAMQIANAEPTEIQQEVARRLREMTEL
ncbi:MAG TPA: hypothetical protein ENI86_05355 [Acidimicrobiales bacterium]|nr:hypothetical protein [Acidimicrobiales bacterium]